MDMVIRAAGDTHRGRVRKNNEDAFYPDPKNGTIDPTDVARSGYLFIVADGVGGNRGGARASEIAVSRVPALFYSAPNGDPAGALRYAFDGAAREIVAEAQTNPERVNMSCTVVAAAVKNGRATIAHLGDARAYLLRNGALQPLTSDHTWVQMQVEKGVLTPAEAENHPDRSVITKSMGNPSLPEPTITEIDLLPGDRLLLCSDGLTGEADDEEIAAVLRRAADPTTTIHPLIDLANRKGGKDNVTVVVVQAGASVPVAAGRRSSLPLLLIVAAAAVLFGGFLYLRTGERARSEAGQSIVIAGGETTTATPEENGTAITDLAPDAAGEMIATSTLAAALIATETISPTATSTTAPTATTMPAAANPTRPTIQVSGSRPGSLCPGNVQAVVSNGQVEFAWRADTAIPPGTVMGVRYGMDNAAPTVRVLSTTTLSGNEWLVAVPVDQFAIGPIYRWEVYDVTTGASLMRQMWCFTVLATPMPEPTGRPERPTRTPVPTQPTATATSEPATPTLAPTDSDGDGVSDDEDQCPNEQPGRDPDPMRPGCPLPPTATPEPTH